MNAGLKAESDYATREAVEAELAWAPEIEDSERIGVAVSRGIVTLSGEVHTFPEKVAAGKAALRTRGVAAVANDLTVRYRPDDYSDALLAASARDALQAASYVPREGIEVEVRDHVIHLSGMAKWEHQRLAAQQSVSGLPGVHWVKNDIRLFPRVSSSETLSKIRAALARNGGVHADNISVDVDGTTVILSGTVSSYLEKREAARVAWSSPHVEAVRNELRIVRP